MPPIPVAELLLFDMASNKLRFYLEDLDRELDLDEQLELEIINKMIYVHRAFEMSCWKTQIVLLRINFLRVNLHGEITKCVALDQSKAKYIKKCSDIIPATIEILNEFRHQLLDRGEKFDRVGRSFLA